MDEIFPELNDVEDKEKFYTIEVALDSGAANHVLSREDVPGYTIAESPGSKRGQQFQVASGKLIPNEGQVKMTMLASCGGGQDSWLESTFQVAQVTRPLLSVSKICERGDLGVLCRENEAFILDKDHKVVARFERRGGLYVTEMRVPNPAHAGFGRQDP